MGSGGSAAPTCVIMTSPAVQRDKVEPEKDSKQQPRAATGSSGVLSEVTGKDAG